MTTVVGVLFPDPEQSAHWRAGLAPLLPECEVTEAELVAPADVDVLVVGNPSGPSLKRYSSVRFVQSAWAGVDRLVDGAPPVLIARMVAPALTSLMAEFVVTAALMIHRGFLQYRRHQADREWRPASTPDISQRRIGVLGFGELGRPCALALATAGFDVAAWARRPRSAEVPVLAGADGWAELMGCSDIVVNLLPLTTETTGILDRAAFARMRRGGSLLNVSRGAHVVDEDLLTALDDGHLSDAVLDVFVVEPLPADHPYWSHPRVTVLPHVAAPSNPKDLAPDVAANIQRFLDGEEPRFLVT